MTAVNVMCESLTIRHHAAWRGDEPRQCDGCGSPASLSAVMEMTDGTTVDIATCDRQSCFHVFAPVRDVLAVPVEPRKAIP